jgi:hypothetical protein
LTVHFTDAPEVTGPALDLDLDALFPALRSKHGNSDPDAVLLRVLVAGLTSNPPLPATAIRRWLASHALAEPLVQAAAANPGRWFRLLQAARKHVASINSPAGLADLRLQIARRMVARISTPIPAGATTPQREVRARHALAIIGLNQIELGYESIVVSGTWLGSRLGVTRITATAILKTLEKDLGWIRRVGQRGSALKWKLTKFVGPQGDELRDRALLHGDAVDALASMHYDEDRLAELIASAAHPAWSYSRARRAPDSDELVAILGSRGWVAAVHHYAALPADEGLGLPKAALSKLKKQVNAELPAVFDRHVPLLEALDAHAVASGAIVYRAERDALAAAEAAVDRARIAEFRIVNAARHAARKALAAVLRKAWSDRGPLGRVPEDVDELAAWTGRAAQIVAEGGLVVQTSDLASAREFIANHVIYRGHEAAKAAKVAGFVFRDAPAAA